MNLTNILRNLSKPSGYLQIALDETVGFIPRVIIQCLVYSVVQGLSFNNDNSEEETYTESALCGILWVTFWLRSLFKTPLNTLVG